MSEEHEHKQWIRFTVYMRGFLGWPFKRVFCGTGSNLSNGELVILRVGSHDRINYACVLWVTAQDIDDPIEGHSHP